MVHGGDEHDDTLGESPEEEGTFDDGPLGPRGALPDPLDRLWMHPSELSPLVGPPFVGSRLVGSSRAGGRGSSRSRPVWTTTIVAGAAGAILTLAVLASVGAIGRSSDHTDAHDAVPTSAIANAQAVAFAVAHSVVAVSVRDKSGTRRGSGVCVRSSGEILTSDRLVGGATDIQVTTSDGVVHPARILGRDSTTDLILLSLGTGVPIAPAAPHTPRAGDMVWVVGAPDPGDTSPWMSSGMVASTDSLVALETGPTTSGLLETGAASNMASAGGALVDSSGRVTGIVLSPVGGSRMTYAVPIATALSVADDLREHGYTTHGALGINGIDGADGPTVTSLVAGGPAARAGMHVGDVVESIDKQEVDSMEDVMALIRHDSPGQPVAVAVRRGSRTLTMSATLTDMVSP